MSQGNILNLLSNCQSLRLLFDDLDTEEQGHTIPGVLHPKSGTTQSMWVVLQPYILQ